MTAHGRSAMNARVAMDEVEAAIEQRRDQPHGERLARGVEDHRDDAGGEHAPVRRRVAQQASIHREGSGRQRSRASFTSGIFRAGVPWYQ